MPPVRTGSLVAEMTKTTTAAISPAPEDCGPVLTDPSRDLSVRHPGGSSDARTGWLRPPYDDHHLGLAYHASPVAEVGVCA